MVVEVYVIYQLKLDGFIFILTKFVINSSKQSVPKLNNNIGRI